MKQTAGMKTLITAGLALVVATMALGSDAILAGGAREVIEDERIVHQAPRVPIAIDGASVRPETVKEYDGVPLYYLPDGDMLRIFTTEEKLWAHVKTMAPRGRATPAWHPDRDDPHQGCGDLTGAYAPPFALFEHVDFCGDQRRYSADEPDLRRTSCFGSACSNWNDKASSFSNSLPPAAYQYQYVVMYEHVHYGGSGYFVNAGAASRRSLVDHGWNDRVSSLRSYNRPPS